MLLPVGTRSATATAAVPVARPVATAEQTAAAPTPNPTVNSAASDAVGSKLNLAMLGGVGRLGENIDSVAEVVGAFLGIAKGDVEPTDAYLARIAAAIDALPEADRLKLQAFLARTYAKLQLNALIAALANPSGKDAITVAIAFEISRDAPGDRQAQTVISSYRQAAGDPLRDSGAYRSPVSQAKAASAPAMPGPAIPTSRAASTESVLPPPRAADPPRAAATEKPATAAAPGLIRDASAQQPASAPKAPGQQAMLGAGHETRSTQPGDPEQGTTADRNSPPVMRDPAPSQSWRDRLTAFLSARQTIESPHTQSGGNRISLEKEAAGGSRENEPNLQADRREKLGVAPVTGPQPAPVPPVAGLDLNDPDLISSLLRLAQQADPPTIAPQAGVARQLETTMPQSPQQGAAHDQTTADAEAPRIGDYRPEPVNAGGHDTNAPAPLTNQAVDVATTVPIAREAVPFAMLHYLVHDEPEEPDSRRKDKEGYEEFEDDRDERDGSSGGDAESDGEDGATDKETRSKDDLLALDGAEQGASDLMEQAAGPTEKFPKPRAQRLQEAQQSGPSYREFSTADPVHQMYLRMSGGI